MMTPALARVVGVFVCSDLAVVCRPVDAYTAVRVGSAHGSYGRWTTPHHIGVCAW